MAAAESRGPRSPAAGRDRWPPDAAAAGWLQPTAPAGFRDCDRCRLRSEPARVIADSETWLGFLAKERAPVKLIVRGATPCRAAAWAITVRRRLREVSRLSRTDKD